MPFCNSLLKPSRNFEGRKSGGPGGGPGALMDAPKLCKRAFQTFIISIRSRIRERERGRGRVGGYVLTVFFRVAAERRERGTRSTDAALPELKVNILN